MNEQEIKKLMKEMPKADNIYPEWVFPMTIKEAAELVRKHIGAPDTIFAGWGRYVWDKAIEAECRLLVEQGWRKGDAIQ